MHRAAADLLWPLQRLLAIPTSGCLWLPRFPSVPAVSGQGCGVCCRGGSPAGSPAVPLPPGPVNLPLAGRASVPRGRLAAICCSIQRAPVLMSPWPRPKEGGEGLEKKSEGEKKSPFLGGAVNSEAFVCPCPRAPAGRRWEQGELIRQLGTAGGLGAAERGEELGMPAGPTPCCSQSLHHPHPPPFPRPCPSASALDWCWAP